MAASNKRAIARPEKNHRLSRWMVIIRAETQVAILQDSDSKSRASEMMDKIYEIEMRLRTIVMYMPSETIELFHKIARAQGLIKQYGEGKITTGGMLDTIADQLTLGEMLQLLGTDISISGNNIQWNTLNSIIQSSKDFNEFATNLSNKLKRQLVWDIITPKILNAPIEWNKIQNDFKTLEKARNSAAHFHTITESEKENLLHLADDILEKIKLKQNVNKKDAAAITSQLSPLSTYLSSMSSLLNPEITSNIARTIQQQLSSIDFASLSEEANRLQEAIRRQGQLLTPYFSSFTANDIQTSLATMNSAMLSIQSELSTLILQNKINIDSYWISSLPKSQSNQLTPENANDKDIQDNEKHTDNNKPDSMDKQTDTSNSKPPQNT